MKQKISYNGFYNIENIIDVLSKWNCHDIFWTLWIMCIKGEFKGDVKSPFIRFHIACGTVRFVLTRRDTDVERILRGLRECPVDSLNFWEEVCSK